MASDIVGYLRMDPKRELKLALESFRDWKSSAGDLQKVAADLQVRPDVKFSYASHTGVAEYKEAKALGVDTVPVLVGPVSYLLLSKPAKGVEESFSLHSRLGKILPIYKEVITELKEAGASWIQFDESTLVMDLESHKLHAFTEAYSALESTLSGLNVLIETYFADIPAEQYKTLTSLKGVTAFGFDLVRGTKTLDLIKGDFPEGKYLYDIHSPRISSTEEMLAVLETNILRVNPDCGLKTRRYIEVKPSLKNIVDAAKFPKPMMVKIMVNNHEYIALIDTGSTYNFLNPRVARELGLKIIKDPIQVSIADSSIMCSEWRCPEFEFVIQEGQFATQAYILQVDGSDVILGVQWLMGLGPIKNWDFASLKMELTQGGKTIQIIGMDTEKSEAGCSTDEQLLSMVREGVKDGAGIGPGVYDIHSPRVPSTEEIADGINKMLETIQVNPDCGLNTRKYTEVKPPLKNKLLRSMLVSAK